MLISITPQLSTPVPREAKDLIQSTWGAEISREVCPNVRGSVAEMPKISWGVTAGVTS
jgi:hypothetical protein